MKTVITLTLEILIYVCMVVYIAGLTIENQIVTGPLQGFLGRELNSTVCYAIGFGAGLLGSILTFGLPLAILQINSSLRSMAGALKR